MPVNSLMPLVLVTIRPKCSARSSPATEPSPAMVNPEWSPVADWFPHIGGVIDDMAVVSLHVVPPRGIIFRAVIETYGPAVAGLLITPLWKLGVSCVGQRQLDPSKLREHRTPLSTRPTCRWPFGCISASATPFQAGQTLHTQPFTLALRATRAQANATVKCTCWRS